MSEEFRFEPVPGVDFLYSDMPTEVVDVVVRHCLPGTPAPPRVNRPHRLTKQRSSEEGQEDSASAGG